MTPPTQFNPVGAPTPNDGQQSQFQLSGYQIMRPRSLPPYVLALWREPGRGMFVAHYDLNGRLLATPGWQCAAEPPALPEEIVAGLPAQLRGSPPPSRGLLAASVPEPAETPVERELRLGCFRDARVLRKEIARQGRQFKPPTTRIPRRVLVNGEWMVKERQP